MMRLFTDPSASSSRRRASHAGGLLLHAPGVASFVFPCACGPPVI